jgi:uncharacterized protein (DUF849 family)
MANVIRKKTAAGKVASNSSAGAKPAVEKIKQALSTKKVRDTVVWQNKNQPAMFNEKNKAKNIRKKLDSDKTAMRAKIIQARRNKPLNITLKDEREMARAMAKATKPKVKVSPMPTLSAQQKQDKALKDLMKKREAESKKTGLYPNYYTN